MRTSRTRCALTARAAVARRHGAPVSLSSPVAPARRPPPSVAARTDLRTEDVWILQLEDERVCAIRRRRPRRRRRRRCAAADAAPPSPPPPPPPPDLVRLLGRRRSARPAPRGAGGRPRRACARACRRWWRCLRDPDPEVRQMAAFALGLIGDASARDPLVAALADPQPLVKGSAAEALGLIGDASGGRRDRAHGGGRSSQSGALAQPPGEETDAQRDTPAAAFRLAIYALVRLKAYDRWRRSCSTPPVSRASAGGRWRSRCSVSKIRAALPALLTLAARSAPVHAGVCGQGPRRAEGSVGACRCWCRSSTGPDRMVAVEAIRALARSATPRGARRCSTLDSERRRPIRTCGSKR